MKLAFHINALSLVGRRYDPSHLVWQFIGPYLALREFGDKIVQGRALVLGRDFLRRIWDPAESRSI